MKSRLHQRVVRELKRAHAILDGQLYQRFPAAERARRLRAGLWPFIREDAAVELPASFHMRVMYALAGAAHLADEPRASHAALARALADAQKLNDVAAQVILHTVIAEVAHDGLQYAAARDQYAIALELLTTGRTHDKHVEQMYRAQLLARLARASYLIGDFATARRYSRFALRILRQSPAEAPVLFHQAASYWMLGMVKRAISRLLGGDLHNLRVSLVAFEWALACYQRTDIERERPFAVARLHIQIAETYCDIAEYWARADVGEFVAQHAQTQRSASLTRARKALADASHLLNLPYTSRQKDVWAWALVRHAEVRTRRIEAPTDDLLEALEQLRLEAMELEDPTLLSSVRTLRGEWLADRGEHEEALVEFQAAIASLDAAHLRGETTRARWGRDRSLAHVNSR